MINAPTALLLVGVLSSGSAFAQIDLSGSWANKIRHENNVEEHADGDYAGTPINESDRLRGYTWNASLVTLPEHQCIPHGMEGIDNTTNLLVWTETDGESHKFIAYHMNAEWMNPHRIIYMDGRPHPPETAPHTFMGFSTGKYEGDVLTVETTHVKESWLKRNGLERSEKATVIEHFIRHVNYLERVILIRDPVYLTEPFIRSSTYVYDPTIAPFGPYPCESVEEIVRPAGAVPANLPGTNSTFNDWADHFGIPHEAAIGGAQTMYPEYRMRLRQLMKPATSAQR